MRIVGNTQIALPSLLPSAAALRQAAVHQATAAALMRVASSGVRKGVYRFATHEAANLASEEAISVAMALNLKRMARAPNRRRAKKTNSTASFLSEHWRQSGRLSWL